MTSKLILSSLLFAIVIAVQAKPAKYLNGKTYKGNVTFYTEWNRGLGSCGKDYTKLPKFVATMSKAWMQPAPNNNPAAHPLCNDICVKINGPQGSMIVQVIDTCWLCGDNDVLVSDQSFKYITDKRAGTLLMNWTFVSCDDNKLGPVKGSGAVAKRASGAAGQRDFGPGARTPRNPQVPPLTSRTKASAAKPKAARPAAQKPKKTNRGGLTPIAGVNSGPQAKQGDKWINGRVYEGDGTYYTEWNIWYGSCGMDYSNIDRFLVAMSKHWMQPAPNNNPNNHPLCAPEYCIQVDGPKGSLVAKITDTCDGCKDYDIDLSDSIYHYVANVVDGRVKMKWFFVDCNEKPPGVLHSSSSAVEADTLLMPTVLNNGTVLEPRNETAQPIPQPIQPGQPVLVPEPEAEPASTVINVTPNSNTTLNSAVTSTANVTNNCEGDCNNTINTSATSTLSIVINEGDTVTNSPDQTKTTLRKTDKP